MKSPCSVWMAPRLPADECVSKILVPVDFSKASADALRTAALLAASRGLADITALHVYFDPAITTYDGRAEALAVREARRFDRFLSASPRLDVEVRTVSVESSNIPGTILRVAGEQAFDLIVMATRGRSAAAAMLLESVTGRVFAGSATAVLAVKNYGAYLGFFEALFDRKLWGRDEPTFG